MAAQQVIAEDIAVFSFGRASVTFHIHTEGTCSDAEFTYEGKSPYYSFEKDMTRHAYQRNTPYFTTNITNRINKYELLLPERIDYNSEGACFTLCVPDHLRRLPINVSLGVTSFKSCGTQVWHLGIWPAAPRHISIWHLISLVKCYTGIQEGTSRSDIVHFQQNEHPQRTIRELFLEIAPPTSLSPDFEISGGSVFIATETAKNNNVDWHAAFRYLKDMGGRQTVPDMDKCLQDNFYIYKGLGGIVGGIYDFDRMGLVEIKEMLTPSLNSSPGLLRLFRNNLLDISDDTSAVERLWDTCGNSPYMLVPMACALNNYLITNEANDHLRNIIYGKTRSSLRIMEKGYLSNKKLLEKCVISDMFQYPSVSEVVKAAELEMSTRSIAAKVREKLEILDPLINQAHRRKQLVASWASSLILAFLAGLSIHPIIDDANKDLFTGDIFWEWFDFILVLVGIVLLSGIFGWKKLRREPHQDT